MHVKTIFLSCPKIKLSFPRLKEPLNRRLNRYPHIPLLFPFPSPSRFKKVRKKLYSKKNSNPPRMRQTEFQIFHLEYIFFPSRSLSLPLLLFDPILSFQDRGARTCTDRFTDVRSIHNSGQQAKIISKNFKGWKIKALFKNTI